MAALIQFATENPFLFGAMMTFMGAVAGGAATQVGYRLPAILDARDAGATPQLGLLQPPSCCPVCGHVLGFSEKIPLAGWFLAGGACQSCGVPLSRAYPLIEAAGALVGPGQSHMKRLSSH
jgi:leader peptidase (prepilin peptidase)/N-methyltransferase